jgi:hypothetical protein
MMVFPTLVHTIPAPSVTVWPSISGKEGTDPAARPALAARYKKFPDLMTCPTLTAVPEEG